MPGPPATSSRADRVVLRVELQEERVNLILQPRSFSNGRISLGCEQIEHRRLVVAGDGNQTFGLAMDVNVVRTRRDAAQL
jgi:hypothetical protein